MKMMLISEMIISKLPLQIIFIFKKINNNINPCSCWEDKENRYYYNNYKFNDSGIDEMWILIMMLMLVILMILLLIMIIIVSMMMIENDDTTNDHHNDNSDGSDDDNYVIFIIMMMIMVYR